MKVTDALKLRPGDIVRFTYESTKSFTKGKHYTVTGVQKWSYGGTATIMINPDDEGDPNGWSSDYFAIVRSFHRDFDKILK